MNKWTMSDHVADVILDSIKRKIADVCGGSFHIFMVHSREPRLTIVIVREASERRVGAAWELTFIARIQHD